MIRFHIAALLALGAASVQAQPVETVQPNTDSQSELQTLQKLTACLAKSRPAWARRTLSRPYLSNAQERDAAEALAGRDSCISAGGEMEVTFRTSGLVGSLADHYLRSELPQVEFAGLRRALATIEPRNASEDFALCIASRNPAAARDLAMSEPGSAAEGQIARQFAPHVPACSLAGEKPTVDQQSLRALISTALYRATRTVLAMRD
ncbi:MAG TPA: hypothetical protein VEW26_09085 [Allosphingosinicella sp.]|nr:hypothetical protein [Allosphingosinicella sp.]